MTGIWDIVAKKNISRWIQINERFIVAELESPLIFNKSTT